MKNTDFALIVDEYKEKLRKEGVEINDNEIASLVSDSVEEAKTIYDLLPTPRLMTQDFYVSHWLRERMNAYFVNKTLKKVSPNSVDPLIKAFSNFFEIFSSEIQDDISSKLSSERTYEKRKEIWEVRKLPVDEIEKRFVDLTEARNKNARRKGFTSFISQALGQHRIPEEEYELFRNNVDKVIKYCSDNLPVIETPKDFFSEFGLPCYLCEVPFPEITYPDGVVEFVSEQYPILKQFKNNFSIVSGNQTNTRYVKEEDKFRITINEKNNHKHKTVDLIHEMGHVVTQVGEYQNGVDPIQFGKYHEERKSVEIELSLLKELSQEVYKVYLGDVLLMILRELFELSIYEHPEQDLKKIYAEFFNKCFPKASQKENILYLLDNRIVLRPLSALPQTVALVNELAR